MNLFYLYSKQIRRLIRSAGVQPWHVDRNGRTWRGVKLEPEGRGRIYVERALECEPFRSRCETPGWYVSGLTNDAEITIRLLIKDEALSQSTMRVPPGGFEPLLLPWPENPVNGRIDLEILSSGSSPVFIASHFDLDRGALLARCKGSGVELGPGPNPRILPDGERQIRYVEEKTPEQWQILYGDHYKVSFKPELRPYYTVGRAHRLPVERESLDFIFSSHVFEHLVNPLGHLRHWSKMLRKGGEVVMVVPDYIGSKDFSARASTVELFRSEFVRGVYEPSLEHYERYTRARGVSKKALEWFESKTSIHVHFYTNENMSQLLDIVVGERIYDSYSMHHCRNAKDFHVILRR